MCKAVLSQNNAFLGLLSLFIQVIEICKLNVYYLNFQIQIQLNPKLLINKLVTFLTTVTQPSHLTAMWPWEILPKISWKTFFSSIYSVSVYKSTHVLKIQWNNLCNYLQWCFSAVEVVFHGFHWTQSSLYWQSGELRFTSIMALLYPYRYWTQISHFNWNSDFSCIKWVKIKSFVKKNSKVIRPFKGSL